MRARSRLHGQDKETFHLSANEPDAQTSPAQSACCSANHDDDHYHNWAEVSCLLDRIELSFSFSPDSGLFSAATRRMKMDRIWCRIWVNVEAPITKVSLDRLLSSNSSRVISFSFLFVFCIQARLLVSPVWRVCGWTSGSRGVRATEQVQTRTRRS